MSNTRRNPRHIFRAAPAVPSGPAVNGFPAAPGNDRSVRPGPRPAETGELAWRKSSFSGGANNCVETAPSGEAVLVRDSKITGGPIIAIGATAWTEFVNTLPGLSGGPATA